MLWHRQAMFESKGDKLSSSAEGRIRTQRVSDTYSPADWMPADKPTELSRINLKNLNSTARPYDQQAFTQKWTNNNSIYVYHDDFIKWKHFPRYWPFVRIIHRSPVDSPHKGHWSGAFMFTLICAWTNAWANNRWFETPLRPLRRDCNDMSRSVKGSRKVMGPISQCSMHCHTVDLPYVIFQWASVW